LDYGDSLLNTRDFLHRRLWTGLSARKRAAGRLFELLDPGGGAERPASGFRHAQRTGRLLILLHAEKRIEIAHPLEHGCDGDQRVVLAGAMRTGARPAPEELRNYGDSALNSAELR
jgi:hypothetical protein